MVNLSSVRQGPLQGYTFAPAGARQLVHDPTEPPSHFHIPWAFSLPVPCFLSLRILAIISNFDATISHSYSRVTLGSLNNLLVFLYVLKHIIPGATDSATV